jgi:hypothetical protein
MPRVFLDLNNVEDVRSERTVAGRPRTSAGGTQ